MTDGYFLSVNAIMNYPSRNKVSFISKFTVGYAMRSNFILIQLGIDERLGVLKKHFLWATVLKDKTVIFHKITSKSKSTSYLWLYSQ